MLLSITIGRQWLLKKRRKKITEQPKMWWKWALLKKPLNIWPAYLLSLVSITSQSSISSIISNRWKPSELIISEDFYKHSLHQNEIMLAHLSEEALSFFCATAHYLKDGKPAFKHYVLCFADLTHDKNTIFF